MATSNGSKLTSDQGGSIAFKKGSDNMDYLVAHRVEENEQVMETTHDTEDKKKNKAKKDPPKVDIMEAHWNNGHVSETILRATMAERGITLTGKWKTCHRCARAKATQKPTKKTTEKKRGLANACTWIRADHFQRTAIGSRYWVKMVDQFRGKSWESYVDKQSKVPETVDRYLTKLNSHGYDVKYVQCDNAGEHHEKLVKVIDKHGATLEYTASRTP